MTSLRGKWIRKVARLGDHVIRWRNPKDDSSSSHVDLLKYNVYKYEIENSGQTVPVFVHEDWTIDDSRQVTNQFQYGDWSGKVFLVLHDKDRYQIPQQSFLCADVADLILPEEGEGGGFGFGVGTFGFMDVLKQFDEVPED